MLSAKLPPNLAFIFMLMVVLGNNLNTHIEATIIRKNTLNFLIIQVIYVLNNCFDGLFFRKTDQVGTIIGVKYFILKKMVHDDTLAGFIIFICRKFYY